MPQKRIVQAYVDLLVKDNELRVVRGKNDKTILKSGSRPVEVPAGEGASITHYLLPLKNGYLPIQATVRSQTAADSVIRNFLVEVRGFFSAELGLCTVN